MNSITIINSILFSLVGVFVFCGSFWLIDRITPYDLWEELVKKRNVALAIVVGCACLGIAIIIAAAIHG
jgi:putative membrane protein